MLAKCYHLFMLLGGTLCFNFWHNSDWGLSLGLGNHANEECQTTNNEHYANQFQEGQDGGHGLDLSLSLAPQQHHYAEQPINPNLRSYYQPHSYDMNTYNQVPSFDYSNIASGQHAENSERYTAGSSSHHHDKSKSKTNSDETSEFEDFLRLTRESGRKNPSRSVVIREPPVETPIAMTGGESKEITLFPPDLHYPMLQQKWFKPNIKNPSENLSASSFYAFLEVVGLETMQDLQIQASSREVFNPPQVKQFKENFRAHGIKSIVTFIYSMDLLSQPAFYSGDSADDQLQKAIQAAVTHLEDFFSRLTDSNHVIRMDPHSDSPFLSSSEENQIQIKKLLERSQNAKVRSQTCSGLLFLMWLRKNFPYVYKNVNQATEPITWRSWAFSLMRLYISTLRSGEYVLSKILETVQNESPFSGQLLAYEVDTKFRVKWGEELYSSYHKRC